MTASAAAVAPPKISARESLALMFKLRRGFWITNTVFLLDGAAYFGILNILTLFLGPKTEQTGAAVGFDPVVAGVLTSTYGGVVTVAAAVFGPLIDKIGWRRTLVYSMALSTAGRALLALSPELPFPQAFAVVALIMAGVAAATTTTGAYAGIKGSTTKDTATLGFSILYAALNGGSILELVVSPLVRHPFGMSGVVLMCTAITAVGFLLPLLGLRKGEGDAVPVPPREKGAKTTWRDHPLAQARFLFFIFILLGVRTLFAHQFLTLNTYITRAYGEDVAGHFEWIDAVNPLIVLVFTPVVALLTQRVHVVTMMIVGTLVSAGAPFLLVPGPDVAMLITSQLVFSIGEAMWSSRFYEWVADIAPPERVGVYMGVAQFPWFLAKFTTGFYSGAMLEVFCPKEGPQRTGTLWLITVSSP